MSKIWLITGAARGIGAEIAKAALAAGNKVVVTGRNVAQLEAAYASHGDKVLALPLDVNDAPAAGAAVARAVAHFGRIDVLVNNAGYGQLGYFEENTAEAIEQQFQTNVFGTFHVTRAVLPVMRGQGAGRIFNLSSVGGMLGFEGASVYCATKFAVEGFSESLAMEVARFGIHVTIVEPGFFRTDFLDGSSVRYGAGMIADYAELSRTLQANYGGHSHQQAGDPAKLGRAIVELSSVTKPPLRYAAGSDALAGIGGKLESVREELAQWRALSASTDGVF